MTTKENAEQILNNCVAELTAYCEGYCSTGGITCGPHFKYRIERIVSDNLCLVRTDALKEAAEIAASKQSLYPKEESTVCLVIHDAILERSKQIEKK